LYTVNPSYALGFTFIPAIATELFWPFGAANLTMVLTDRQPVNKWYFDVFNFLKIAIPPALCGTRTKQRRAQIAALDLTSSSGKFKMSKFNMAEMVECTCVRVMVCVLSYMLAGLLYGSAVTKEVRARTLIHTLL